jgi:hypothetical protein
MKWLVSYYGQNKSYFWHFFSCWFFILFSDNSKCFHHNGFEPTRILNSEISWLCFDFPKWGPSVIHYYRFHCFFSSFSNKLIKSEWNSLQLIIFKVKHTWNNFLQGKKYKKFNFFQIQNDTCAHLFTLVMKFHDRQSSERCIRKLISRHCLDKTRTKWNDFLFLITHDRDFRPQTCTNGLVFRECKHIKNIFEDVYFTKNRFILL